MRSEWTVETLREQILALRSADAEAVKAALASLNARLDSMNEFRATLRDQQSMMATRNEVGAQTHELETKIEANVKNVARCPTRGEIYALVAAAGVIGGMIGHYLR
jgi:hypothetical protein